MKMLIFIVNLTAGNGKAKKVWAKVERECKQQGVNYRTFFTEREHHAEQIAKQVATIYHEKLLGITVVGGDGTLHEAINGLKSFPDIPVGLIPAGSGNDFARGFSIPKSPRKIIKSYVKRNYRPRKRIDIGRLRRKNKKDDVLFVNALGAGFDGEVAKTASRAWYKGLLNAVKLGGFVYLIAVVQRLFTYRLTEVTLEIDGLKRDFEDVWLVAVSNHPYYGGGMKISPEAKGDHGQFQICLVHQLSRMKLFFLLFTVFFGKHGMFDGVKFFHGTSVNIISDQPMTVQEDGEQAGTTPVTVEIHEQTIPIL